MRVYAASVLLYAFSLEDVLSTASELGYDGVEIWHYHLLQTGESPQKLRRQAQELNLSLSCHALSWDLNFTSQLPSIREESLRLLESSIEVAAELNATPVVVHPGRMTAPQDDVEAYWPWLVDGVVKLGQCASAVGTHVSMEVMEHVPKEFFTTPQDANRLMRELNFAGVSITFDAAHVPWVEDPLAYLMQFSHVHHVHLSDANEHKIHLALGEGGRDFLPLLRYIDGQVPGVVTIEGMEFVRTTALAQKNKSHFDFLMRHIRSHPEIPIP